MLNLVAKPLPFLTFSQALWRLSWLAKLTGRAGLIADWSAHRPADESTCSADWSVDRSADWFADPSVVSWPVSSVMQPLDHYSPCQISIDCHGLPSPLPYLQWIASVQFVCSSIVSKYYNEKFWKNWIQRWKWGILMIPAITIVDVRCDANNLSMYVQQKLKWRQKQRRIKYISQSYSSSVYLFHAWSLFTKQR